MTPRVALSLTFFIPFLIANSVRAQTGSPTNRAAGFWLELGAGVGKAASTSGNAAVSGGLDWQRGTQLVSLRGDAVSTSWSSSVAQVALLLGRATDRQRSRFGAASAGLAFVRSAECIRNCGILSSGPADQQTHSGVGAAGAITGAIRAGNRGGIGIGITAFANVNSLSSFAGATVTLSGGRWR